MGMLKIKRLLAIVSMCIIVLGNILYSPIVAYADTGKDEPGDYQAISRQIEEDVERYHIPGMSIIIVDADDVCQSGSKDFILYKCVFISEKSSGRR